MKSFHFYLNILSYACICNNLYYDIIYDVINQIWSRLIILKEENLKTIDKIIIKIIDLI